MLVRFENKRPFSDPIYFCNGVSWRSASTKSQHALGGACPYPLFLKEGK